MADLTFQTAATLIERALFNTINRGLRIKLSPVADVATLRTVSTRGAGAGSQRQDFDLVYVIAAGVCFEWSSFSTAIDDGVTVIAPADCPVNGRWLATPSTATTGYLRAVRLYEGEQTEDEILTRLLSRQPAVAVRWESASHEPKSQIPGALYRYESRFDIWCISSNLRGGVLPEAVVGSAIPYEAALDPGVNWLVGDVKQLLAGKTGDELGQPGIMYCEITTEEPVYRSLAERLFVYSLGVKVHATVANPDTDLVTVSGFANQSETADNHDQPAADPDNCITSGLSVPWSYGLTQTVAAGTAMIGGIPVNALATLQVFTANSDTYRDLSPAGTWTFVAVAHGSSPPAITVGSMRVGCTETSSTGVTDDRFIAPTLLKFGSPDIL